MKRMIFFVGTALSQFVCLSSAAGAQESTAYGNSDYGGGWATPSLDVTQSIVSESINRRIIDDIIAGRNRADTPKQRDSETDSPSGSIAPASAAARLDFVLSAQRRSRNYSAFIARSQAENPGAAAFYDHMFASNRYMDRLDGSLRAKGLKPNSIADAFAVHWLSTWYASRGQPSQPTVAQTEATRTMAIRFLGDMPSLGAMNDAAKQEVADDLLIKAGLLDGLTGLSAGDSGLLQTISRVAHQSALQWGLDLDAMVLTDKGFVFRKP